MPEEPFEISVPLPSVPPPKPPRPHPPMEKTAKKTDEAASDQVQPPEKRHPSEVEESIRLEMIEGIATQGVEGGRLADVGGKAVKEHLAFMEQQKDLLPLTNAVLSGQKLRLNPEGTLVPEERVGTSAERTGASEEAREAALALLQRFDEAEKHALQTKDAQYMRELFAALITNEWLAGAANHHPEVAEKLQQTAEMLLQKESEPSPGTLPTGVRWLQSVPPKTAVHTAIDQALDKTSRDISPEVPLQKIERLYGEVEQLRDDKKLLLTKSGLHVSQRQPNLLSYLSTRTGASAQAQKAAEDCLDRMADLAQFTSGHPNHRAKLKDSLLALGQSTWFQGVLRHHPETAKKFFETARVVCDIDQATLIQLGACVKDTETARLFSAHLAAVPTVQKLIGRSLLLSERLSGKEYTPTLGDVHEMAFLKRNIDALAATSQFPEELASLRSRFEQRIQIHAERALENLASFSHRRVVLALRDMIGLTSSPPVNEQLCVARDRCVDRYVASANESLAKAEDLEDIHAIFEEASQLKASADETTAKKFEPLLDQCRTLYEDRTAALVQTALSPVDLATEEGKVPVQQEAVHEFSLIMSRLTPEGQKKAYGSAGTQVLATLRQGKTKEARSFLKALSREELHELQLTIEDLPSSDEKTAALELIKQNEVLNGDRKVSIEETAEILLEALKNGDQRTACIRVLTRGEREQLRKTIETASQLAAGEFAVRQAEALEPHPSRDEALLLIRRENTRSFILMASNPEFLKSQMEQCTTEEERKELANAAQVSVFSLVNFAGNRTEIVDALDLLLQEDPPPIPHEQLGSFALRWTQAYQSILPPSKDADQFQRETDQIRERLVKMAQGLEKEGKTAPGEYKNLSKQLHQAASTFCKVSAGASLLPGQEPTIGVVQEAIKAHKSSETYTKAVNKLAQDLYQISAAIFMERSPGALSLATKNPAEVMDIKTATGITTYVATTILNQENPGTPQALADAQKAFVFWLDVAKESIRLGDYNTASAIAGALGSAAVERLILDKSTNTYLIGSSDAQKWEKLQTQINPANGYAAPRTAVHEHIEKHQRVIPPVLMPVAEVILCGEGGNDVRVLGNAIALVHECQKSLTPWTPQPQTTTVVQDIKLGEGFKQGAFDNEANTKSLKLRPRPSSPPRT